MTTPPPQKKKPQNMDVIGFQHDPLQDNAVSVTEVEKMGVKQREVKLHRDINGVRIQYSSLSTSICH